MSGPPGTDDVTAPRPEPDADSRAFWDELAAHRIVLQRCAACRRRRFPPVPSCPYCADPESILEQVVGSGRVYSFVVVHRAFDPAFAADVPYTVATVDLDGGGRVAGRLEGVPAVNATVAPTFVDHPGWTELRFRVVGG